MIKPVKLLLKVLRGNVINEGKVVNVIKRSYPLDVTPCITINDTGGKLLSKDLIQYRNDEGIVEVLDIKRDCSMTVNVWCTGEDLRDNLNNQVMDLFYRLECNDYRFCVNFNDDVCGFDDETCRVLTLPYQHRSVKKQCPHPDLYDYNNQFFKYDVIPHSFVVDEPIHIDDTSTKPVTLHSVFKVRTAYHDYYNIGGSETINFKIENDLF